MFFFSPPPISHSLRRTSHPLFPAARPSSSIPPSQPPRQVPLSPWAWIALPLTPSTTLIRPKTTPSAAALRQREGNRRQWQTRTEERERKLRKQKYYYFNINTYKIEKPLGVLGRTVTCLVFKPKYSLSQRITRVGLKWP